MTAAQACAIISTWRVRATSGPSLATFTWPESNSAVATQRTLEAVDGIAASRTPGRLGMPHSGKLPTDEAVPYPVAIYRSPHPLPLPPRTAGNFGSATLWALGAAGLSRAKTPDHHCQAFPCWSNQVQSDCSRKRCDTPCTATLAGPYGARSSPTSGAGSRAVPHHTNDSALGPFLEHLTIAYVVAVPA